MRVKCLGLESGPFESEPSALTVRPRLKKQNSYVQAVNLMFKLLNVALKSVGNGKMVFLLF